MSSPSMPQGRLRSLGASLGQPPVALVAMASRTPTQRRRWRRETLWRASAGRQLIELLQPPSIPVSKLLSMRSKLRLVSRPDPERPDGPGLPQFPAIETIPCNTAWQERLHQQRNGSVDMTPPTPVSIACTALPQSLQHFNPQEPNAVGVFGSVQYESRSSDEDASSHWPMTEPPSGLPKRTSAGRLNDHDVYGLECQVSPVTMPSSASSSCTASGHAGGDDAAVSSSSTIAQRLQELNRQTQQAEEQWASVETIDQSLIDRLHLWRQRRQQRGLLSRCLLPERTAKPDKTG